MEQFSLFQPKNVLKVSQLTTYLRQLLEDDPILQDVWVEGEISNFASHHPATFTSPSRMAMLRSAVSCGGMPPNG